MNDPLINFGTNVAKPQTEQAHPAQRVNNAGGYSFTISPLQQLERFLILGTWGGTYYVGEKELTKQNFDNMRKTIESDADAVLDLVLDVSLKGRAYKQNPTLFTLAALTTVDDPKFRAKVNAAIPQVCRTGTMLFTFLGYMEQFRGWGRAMKRTVGEWYTKPDINHVANQLVKYRSRNGWSHRDVLRLAKPKVEDAALNNLFAWAVNKNYDVEILPEIVRGFLEAQTAANAKEWVKLIEQYKLPWEALPTQALNEPLVWEALLPHLGLTAVLRNLGKLGAAGALTNHSNVAKLVNARITDAEAIRKSRVHPMQVLLAATTYAAGHGVKGTNKWDVVGTVKDNLDDAFYASFGNLPQTNKRRFLALDVSGSMTYGNIVGTHLTPRVASAALAMVALRQDPESYTYGFCHSMTPLNLSAKMRLEDVMKKVHNLPFGTTDCAQPMVFALANKLECDSFEVYTDNETWAGRIHPHHALAEYRTKMAIPAKLVVNGMTATNFTIADPSDAGSLDVVGFDASTPSMVSDFICN